MIQQSTPSTLIKAKTWSHLFFSSYLKRKANNSTSKQNQKNLEPKWKAEERCRLQHTSSYSKSCRIQHASIHIFVTIPLSDALHTISRVKMHTRYIFLPAYFQEVYQETTLLRCALMQKSKSPSKLHQSSLCQCKISPIRYFKKTYNHLSNKASKQNPLLMLPNHSCCLPHQEIHLQPWAFWQTANHLLTTDMLEMLFCFI